MSRRSSRGAPAAVTAPPAPRRPTRARPPRPAAPRRAPARTPPAVPAPPARARPSAREHTGRTSGQRGWNGHPDGRSRGSGGSPARPDGFIRNAGSPIVGNAAASARVYGCAGDANTSSLGPSSTIRPAYMTASRRHTAASVERSWVMNSTASPNVASAGRAAAAAPGPAPSRRARSSARRRSAAAGRTRAPARSARAGAARRRAGAGSRRARRAGSPTSSSSSPTRVRHASAPRRPRRVQLDRLADLVADALHRVERVQRALEDDRHARSSAPRAGGRASSPRTSSPSSRTSPVDLACRAAAAADRAGERRLAAPRLARRGRASRRRRGRSSRRGRPGSARCRVW